MSSDAMINRHDEDMHRAHERMDMILCELERSRVVIREQEHRIARIEELLTTICTAFVTLVAMLGIWGSVIMNTALEPLTAGALLLGVAAFYLVTWLTSTGPVVWATLRRLPEFARRCHWNLRFRLRRKKD